MPTERRFNQRYRNRGSAPGQKLQNLTLLSGGERAFFGDCSAVCGA
ncbi:MAG: hypothetical protein L6V93_06845 [Clostridiales bacterium]|nr:MAG: hypothetical protein L6V93_06845 [Clostridiales bacterium]